MDTYQFSKCFWQLLLCLLAVIVFTSIRVGFLGCLSAFLIACFRFRVLVLILSSICSHVLTFTEAIVRLDGDYLRFRLRAGFLCMGRA